MNILFIGDIFGKTGRKMIATYLPKIVEKYSVECVIANGENTSHGKGLLQKHYDELLSHGISLITMGNHTYSKKEIFEYIDEADKLYKEKDAVYIFMSPNDISKLENELIEKLKPID